MAVSYHLPSSNLLEHFMPLLCLVTLLLTSSRRQKPSGRHLLIFVLPNLYTHLHMSFSVLFGKYPSFWGFPGGAVVKNTPANAGHSEDMGSISRLGRSPGGGNGNPLQYSCLENSTGRGTWQATMHGVSKRLCESPESPQLHTAHSIPPSVNSSALTFHWILVSFSSFCRPFFSAFSLHLASLIFFSLPDQCVKSDWKAWVPCSSQSFVPFLFSW